MSDILKAASVVLGGGHFFLAGCWLQAGQILLALGSVVLGLMIPGLLLVFG